MKNSSIKTEIIKLRILGYSVDDIAKQVGCAKSTVSFHINKENLGGALSWVKKVQEDQFLKEISIETILNIRSMRLAGDSYETISKSIPLTEDKLRKICSHLRLNVSSKNINAIMIDNKKLLEYYQACKSLKETAYYFGIATNTVKNLIGKENIIIRQKKVTKSQTVINWRKRTKIKLVEYKGGKCECCGYNKSNSALQFHHKDPNEKDFTIGGSSYSFERLKTEVDKCILVCSNCHIEIHDNLRKDKLQ
jgi:DNA-binding CsgD family transcriptional regulator